METKRWYQSKTLWANIFILMVAAFKHFGVDGEGATLDEGTIMMILGVANIGLRFVTKHPIAK